MSERTDRALRRLATTLAESEYVAEGGVQSWNRSSPDSDRDHADKSVTDALAGRSSLHTRCAELVEETCARLERLVRDAKRHELAELSKQQLAYYVLSEDGGKRARDVADRHGIPVSEVHAIRLRAELTAERGEQRKSNAGRKPKGG